MSCETYTETVKITQDLADNRGFLSLYGVLCLNQHAGEQHLEVMGHSPRELIEDYNITFIFARLHLRIHRLPGVGQRVTVTTWCGPVEGLYYPRHYCIRDEAGDLLTETFAYAAALDVQKRKLIRPGNAGPIEDFLYYGDPGSCAKPARLHLAKDLPHSLDFAVTKAHLDYNGHMNNAHYATILCAAAQKAGLTPEHIYLQFHSEAMAGDTVTVDSALQGGRLEIRGTHPRGVCFEAVVE